MHDNNSKGWVYFIVCDLSRRVKIGWSSTPALRLRDIRTMSPTELRLAAAYPGTPVDEFETHKRFADLRLHGEWFHLTGEVEALIQSAIEKHGPEPWEPVREPQPRQPQPGEPEYEEMVFRMKLNILERIKAGQYRWGKNDLRLYGDILLGIKEPEIPYHVELMRS